MRTLKTKMKVRLIKDNLLDISICRVAAMIIKRWGLELLWPA